MKNKFTFKTKFCAGILGLCITFSFTDSFAQGTGDTGGGSSGDLAIGAKIGINLNQFSQPGTTVGGSAGGYARYELLNFLEVQGELIYSLKGGGRTEYIRDLNVTSSSSSLANSVEYINRSILLHTVELPISARLGLPELNGGTIVPKLIVGGSYSYVFSASENSDAIFSFNNGNRGLVSDTKENVAGDYFAHVYSAHMGIALDFNLENSKSFTMEFKYRKGLNNINTTKTTITELTDKLYSSGFSVNFSYRIF